MGQPEYRIKKNYQVPGTFYPAGTILTNPRNGSFYSTGISDKYKNLHYSEYDMSLHPDWFEKVEERKIVVKENNIQQSLF